MMVEWQTKDGMSIEFPAKYLAPHRTLILLWRPPKPLLRGGTCPLAPPASTPLPHTCLPTHTANVFRPHRPLTRYRLLLIVLNTPTLQLMSHSDCHSLSADITLLSMHSTAYFLTVLVICTVPLSSKRFSLTAHPPLSPIRAYLFT